MRTVFCLLLLSSGVSAQSLLFPKDSAVVKEIELPSKEPFDTARSYSRVSSPYVYIISDKDVYDIFGYDKSRKYFNFDFSEYHVLGELVCRQCLKYCHHDEGRTACHRNRCNREWVWVMRDNKKAFTEIPSFTFPGYINGQGTRLYYDTVILSSPDSANWYTNGHGDCFAHFDYALFADRYHPVLLLKEWNYWGGCRAGKIKEFTIAFKEPPGILFRQKRTILMDKKTD